MSSSTEGMFSFDTPQAVMHVLASVRKSELSPNDKNSLRDLVLSYTNGGKDPSVKIQIEQKLNSLAVQPLPQTDSQSDATPAVVPAFGSSRTAPAFTVPTAAPVQKPTIPVVPVATLTSTPAPEPVVPATPQPVVVQQPAPVVAPAPQPIPAPKPPVAQPAPVATNVDNTAALARVREIKAVVNEKIGNPVNLVDIDNQVGREYMSALLDAMKKLSSGANSVSTMQRLEAAFADVERVLEEPRPAPEVAPEPKPASIVEPAQAPEPVVSATPEPVADLEPTPAPAIPEPVSTPIEDNRWNAASHAIKPTVVKPLSESAEPLKSVEDVPTQDSLINKDADPLQSQEVSEGLNQLLSDWVLFKKSGLFGTGPNGIEHPLYKNIMQLQIPLLLAGRFEGATQEIKQSITDYMNGWRYEQGIIYEQGETFDHYLRRVIRHILDLQK